MTSLRCHFDADGWLQGPIKITHLVQLTPNRYDSGFAAKARGMVQHTEDGFEAGTIATFMNPDAQASAFFSVDELGNAHQYLPVGHGYVAWAQKAGNPDWRSCEFEDRRNPGSPMTQPQLVAGAQILEALSEYDDFPLAATDDPNGRGVITHGDGGQAWGGHLQCPGSVRKAQRPKLIALSIAIRQEDNVTTPPAARPWTTAGMSSLAELAKAEGTQPSTILRLTAEHSPGSVYPGPVADWLNGVFAGTADISKPMPKGLALYLPAAS